jgi:hypothetical protein
MENGGGSKKIMARARSGLLHGLTCIKSLFDKAREKLGVIDPGFL